MAAATVFTASVLARPGTPSTRRWPRPRSATRMRSRRGSWPTITFLISYRSRSILVGWASLIMSCSFLARRDPEPARGDVDGHREGDAGEGALPARVDDRRDDAHHLAAPV